ncbi:hypothetical protein MTR_8g027110 [Medicago truncatula]|uniref:Uncharacterized protein n=1 Tax=Medicago truncatula TaxID=3880 RepID=G7LAU1_MEDTR|nr:hypothetical protein MTR_8g027110 [Medicago truncatula]
MNSTHKNIFGTKSQTNSYVNKSLFFPSSITTHKNCVTREEDVTIAGVVDRIVATVHRRRRFKPKSENKKIDTQRKMKHIQPKWGGVMVKLSSLTRRGRRMMMKEEE